LDEVLMMRMREKVKGSQRDFIEHETRFIGPVVSIQGVCFGG